MASTDDNEPPTKRSRSEKDQNTNKNGSTSTSTSASASVSASDSTSIQNPLDIFSPKILENSSDFAQAYKEAKPYSHGRLEDLFVDGFAEKVLDEVKNNLKAKFKESDLFRVYQSIDLANLNPSLPENNQLAETMPAMMTLRQGLYSSEWRSFIESISGLEKGTLTDQVDCAINCHDKGCHLLCHDDVIGTRKVSYILYFTDEEPLWKDVDGGRLELYESITEEVKVEVPEEIVDTTGAGVGGKRKTETILKRMPGVIPVKTILPKFNSMAYFVVEPGVSFHSVQEVFCDRPRLSIQGWYHAKEAPKEIEHASLNQLKANTHDDADFEGEFTPIEQNGIEYNCDTDHENLSVDDLKFLSSYINATYLKPESIKEICERFEEESSVQLRHFFNKEWERKVTALLQEDDEKLKLGRNRPDSSLNYSIGASQDWALVGPAHKQRFLEYIGNAEEDVNGGNEFTSGSILKHLKDKVMQSPAFNRLLKNYTSLGMPLGHRGRVRRFRPGLDYTIAHYGILTKTAVLDATMCFVSGKGDQSLGQGEDNDDDVIWQSDDKGGFECYIAADDEEDGEGEAEDEYDEDDDTKLLSVSASNNTLSLVYRDPGTMRFVKYLGIGAPSSRWDLCLEYEVPDDDDDDDEDDDDDKNDDKNESNAGNTEEFAIKDVKGVES